ncbi:MAG TPA: CBS domain-containing protein [Solirubrobacteraceae bacterium]|nr:CBS domain-containing protein [Solirubrobacteraceae bacterium]
MADGRLSHAEAIEMTVAEVMVPVPKTLPSDAKVRDVETAFENPSVRVVVLADGGVFRGAIERADLPEGDGADEPASRYANSAPLTARPAMSMREAVELLDQCREPRLVVLDDDGETLRGMVCMSRSQNSFCVG